jgi:hypothetical protein
VTVGFSVRVVTLTSDLLLLLALLLQHIQRRTDNGTLGDLHLARLLLSLLSRVGALVMQSSVHGRPKALSWVALGVERRQAFVVQKLERLERKMFSIINYFIKIFKKEPQTHEKKTPIFAIFFVRRFCVCRLLTLASKRTNRMP